MLITTKVSPSRTSKLKTTQKKLLSYPESLINRRTINKAALPCWHQLSPHRYLAGNRPAVLASSFPRRYLAGNLISTRGSDSPTYFMIAQCSLKKLPETLLIATRMPIFFVLFNCLPELLQKSVSNPSVALPPASALTVDCVPALTLYV